MSVQSVRDDVPADTCAADSMYLKYSVGKFVPSVAVRSLTLSSKLVPTTPENSLRSPRLRLKLTVPSYVSLLMKRCPDSAAPPLLAQGPKTGESKARERFAT